MTIQEIPEVAVVRDAGTALTLLDPERWRLAQALAEAPDSASGLARRLGEKRQRLNYHLRLMEQAGLVELLEERRRGSRTERVLRPTARRFLLDPSAAGGSTAADPEAVGDRFSASYLIALAARAIREVAELVERGTSQRARIASASFNTTLRVRSPRHFDAFARDLTRAVAGVVARHHDESGTGRWFRVVGAAYPGPHPSPHPEVSDE